ncbi:MAG: ABC transporter ATP-binding protein [Deltaproteobacteria bacterium]|nr:ABC transporter ATP-binding protein [Deltaproteobacteria bacterium]
MADDVIISYRGVKKAFGGNVIYDGLDLDILRGETITVIGGSGTGKSVMLKMLIGLLRPDAGHVWFDGAEVTALHEDGLIPVRRRIAMLFQGAALFDSLTVAENIEYPLREHMKMNHDERAERVREVLDLVGLPGIEAMKPAELSGGMKKRIGLARAIAVRPEVIMYDEPTTGLDPINTSRINELIVRTREALGVTSIVVTHDMASAFKVSDRIAMLFNRRISAVGTVSEISRSDDEMVRSFIEGRPAYSPSFPPQKAP